MTIEEIKELKLLAKEARKYKSAEEFVGNLIEKQRQRLYVKNENWIPPEDLIIRVNVGKKANQDILIYKKTGEVLAPIATEAEKREYLMEGYGKEYVWDWKKVQDFYNQAIRRKE